jgi:hypothetical protein
MQKSLTFLSLLLVVWAIPSFSKTKAHPETSKQQVDLVPHTILSGPDANGVLYVKKGSSGTGNSWGNALGELADALKLAKGDATVKQIWVSKGTYKPLYTPDDGRAFADSAGLVAMSRDHRERTFLLVPGVSLYGGFDPDNGITDLTHARILPNLTKNELGSEIKGTVLSGDNNNDDAISGTAPNHQLLNNVDNTFSVLMAIGSSQLVVDGFTVRGGASRTIQRDRYVDGMWIYSGTEAGGGLFAYNAAGLSVKNVSFYSNFARIGGAVYFNECNVMSFSDVSFYRNIGELGGALAHFDEDMGNRVSLTRATVAENRSDGYAAVSSFGALTASQCTFYGNEGPEGALYLAGYGVNRVTNSLFFNNPAGGITMKNTAVIIGTPYQTNMRIINTTIVDNDKYGIYTETYDAQFINCIVHNNSLGTYDQGQNTKVFNSLMQSRFGTTGDGANSRYTDPMFVDAANGDYRLRACSPAIDAGVDTYSATFSSDLDGNARKFGSSNTDIGAFEFSGTALTANDLLAGDAIEADAAIPNVSTAIRTINSDCRVVATVQSWGGTLNVSGDVHGKVWVDATPNSKYVRRHFEITPVTNPNGVTGSVTLYFTQADFDAFNEDNDVELPHDPTDTGNNKANVLIEKRGGQSSDNSGTPSSYPGTVQTITPAEVFWNPVSKIWEVQFITAGFSGFFLKTTSSPLPVRWISFAGRPDEQGRSVLRWEADEVGVASYTVERSYDARLFTKVDEVTAVGTGRQSYTVTDQQMPYGQVYYRILQKDLDGSFSYSKIISLTGREGAPISVYPNPARGEVTVELQSDYTTKKLKITNTNGLLVGEAEVKDKKVSIDLTGLAPGLYLIQTEDGRVMKLVAE